jgi:hypothetical protein
MTTEELLFEVVQTTRFPYMALISARFTTQAFLPCTVNNVRRRGTAVDTLGPSCFDWT